MAIQIKAKRNGFRRCGIAHSADDTTYPDDRFSVKELKILKAEPMLVVTEVTGGASKTPRPNVKDTIALVNAAGTIEEIERLTEGEDRKSVLDALDKRLAVIEAKE